MRRALGWLDERTGYRRSLAVALDEEVLGGASFAYVFGSVLVFLLLMQAVTGVFLAMYYSPSATDAWASVAFIEDQVTAGWFVRGLHSHGASAMVIVCGLHMLQTALYGAYKKPREVNWIVGCLMFALILAFALTGYLLPWDQTGYWATKVATGIAGSSPLVGEPLQQAVQGGNEYGNLTLTRFYAIHVLLLPALVVGLTALHLALFRRHKHTPHWWLSDDALAARAEPFWPGQLFRDVVAMAAVFAGLVGVNWALGGAGLEAPADPASSFDARPEWYFRPLFQALKYFEGPLETAVALGAPVVVGAVLLGLPFVDRGPSRSPRKRIAYLAVLGAGFAAAGGLTIVSLAEDAGDPVVAEAAAQAEERAETARALAVRYGVPAEGGVAVYGMDPAQRARTLWEQDCAACHEGAEREGPEIGPGYNSRAWIRAFFAAPSGPLFFGPTEIDTMKPVKLEGAELDAVVELVYAQTGADDADPALVARGLELFEDGSCSDCHSIDGETEGDIGPNLGGRGSAAMLATFIREPAHPLWFGDDNEMPAVAADYSDAELRALAEYIAALRTQPWPGGAD